MARCSSGAWVRIPLSSILFVLFHTQTQSNPNPSIHTLFAKHPHRAFNAYSNGLLTAIYCKNHNLILYSLISQTRSNFSDSSEHFVALRLGGENMVPLNALEENSGTATGRKDNISLPP
ncbi:uncharacterized protein IAS62_003798 [Cryptococcus decagattii]|uniref:Uncharacterized protein n=1 Tax=Cryptococcus decagattii TaxID=1859122 RepID=A0ABZ2AVA7_9TREE